MPPTRSLVMQTSQVAMLPSSRATRVAWLGLVAVVFCLSTFSIVAAYVVQTRVAESRRGDVRHEVFQDATAAILADEAMQLESLVLPSAEHDEERILADRRVIDFFHRIGTLGGPEDAELATDLLRLHEQYLHVYAGISAAAAAGDHL